MVNQKQRGTAGDRTICLPIADDIDYEELVEDREAYRTSNQVNRPMNYLDRALYAMQDFHGTWETAELSVCSMALLWNFHPFCRKTQQQNGGCLCPFEQLNGFRYHDDWMRNLLIASSLNGLRPLLKSPYTKCVGTRSTRLSQSDVMTVVVDSASSILV